MSKSPFSRQNEQYFYFAKLIKVHAFLSGSLASDLDAAHLFLSR